MKAALELGIGDGGRVAVGLLADADDQPAFGNVAQHREDFDGIDRLAFGKADPLRPGGSAGAASRRGGALRLDAQRFGARQRVEIGQVAEIGRSSNRRSVRLNHRRHSLRRAPIARRDQVADHQHEQQPDPQNMMMIPAGSCVINR